MRSFRVQSMLHKTKLYKSFIKDYKANKDTFFSPHLLISSSPHLIFRFPASGFLAFWLSLSLLGCSVSSHQIAATHTTVPAETAIKDGAIISKEQTWSGRIQVLGTVMVADNATLTIERGSEVKFFANLQDPSKLIVHGNLYCEGTMEQPITFISDSTSPKPGDWGGLVIASSSLNSKLRYCRIQYHKALVFMSDSIEISDSIIAESQEVGIRCESASPRISNSLITKNPTGVKCVRNSSPEISNNNIVGNGFGIVSENSSFPKIFKNLISSNRQHAISCYSASSPEIVSNNITQNIGWAVYNGGKLEDNFIQGNNRSGSTSIDTSTDRSSSQYYGVEGVEGPRTLPTPDAGARRR